LPRLVFWFFVILFLFYFAGKFYIVIPGGVYPGVHLAMEFALIITATCASLMSWYDYKYKFELRPCLRRQSSFDSSRAYNRPSAGRRF
jgi:hypothetical protein